MICGKLRSSISRIYIIYIQKIELRSICAVLEVLQGVPVIRADVKLRVKRTQNGKVVRKNEVTGDLL